MSQEISNFSKKTQHYNLRDRRGDRLSKPNSYTVTCTETVNLMPCAPGQRNSKETMEKKLDTIMEQLANLQSVPAQLTVLNERILKMEEKVKSMKGSIADMAESVEFMEHEVDKIKANTELKVNKTEVADIRGKISTLETSFGRKMEDLENRSRRNNLVFYGVPEGPRSCEYIIKNEILANLMELDVTDVEIERAHRTPGGPEPSDPDKQPRPIHVRFQRFSDREGVLHSAKKLKGKSLGGNSIYISDDVSSSVRNSRKCLRRQLDKIRQRNDVKYAYIPWTVPAAIITVFKDGSRKKILDVEPISD